MRGTMHIASTELLESLIMDHGSLMGITEP